MTFDVILENCLADAPADRFEDVAKLRASLGSLVAPTSVVPASSAAVDEGFDIPVDVDVDMGAPVEQAPPVQSAPVVQVPPVKAPAPKPAPRPAPAMAAPPPPPPPPPPPEPAIPRASVPTPALNEVQLRDLIRAEAQDDSPRWMYVINNLDHGPFTALEIMQAVKEHKVTEDDVVFNMDSGERRKLFEWPQFQDLGAQARETRKRKKRDKEAEGAIAQERTSTRAKALVGGTLIVVIGGLVALYFTTLSPSARQARREAELNAKLASGALRTTGSSVEITDEPPPPTSTTNSGPRRPRPSGSVSFTSYEEAMRAPVDMDINSGMGARLSGSDIQAPLNAALDRFARCATSDISRGNDTHQVKIRVAVNGNGQPIGANILTGSPQFKSCMLGIIKGLKWRAYGGQRMGFGWGFSVDE